jgi:hypothetical protein
MSIFRDNAEKTSGFARNGSLMSNLHFQGVVRIAEKSARVKIGRNGDDDVKYYIIKDEFGAQFSTFDEKLYDDTQVGESMTVYGKVRISKGNTYLNLERITPIVGNDLKTNWDNVQYIAERRQEMIDCDFDTVLVTKWEEALKNRHYSTLTEIELKLDNLIVITRG